MRRTRATTAATATTSGTRAASITEPRWLRYAACAAALKPGGFLVVVTKNLRAGGALHDLAGDTVGLCQAAGLLYWQHVIALHAAIRASALVARPSFWQLSTTRKALSRGERIHLVCHEDVLVFRKPDVATDRRSEGAVMRRA